MANLTYANAKTQLKNQLAGLIALSTWVNTVTTGLLARGDTQMAASTGTYGRLVQDDWWSRLRTPISRVLAPSNILAAMRGPLLDIAAAIDLQAREPRAILAEWARYRRAIGGAAITNITQANPAVVTSASHGLSDNEWVRISGVVGMTQVNDLNFKVANKTDNTFELTGVNSSGYTAYSSGGYWVQIETFNSRDLSIGSATAHARNVGNGTIRRYAVDEDAYPIELCHAETKIWQCIADQNTQGEKHRELFRVEGEDAEPDYCKVDGSGTDQTIRCLTTQDSLSFLANPTFSTFSGTAPTAGVPTTLTAADEVTGWTVTTYASAQVQLDTTYRDLTGESNTYALTFTGNNAITQTLIDERRAQLRADVPYYLQVAVYRASSCDGTLTIAFGRQSEDFTMSGLNNSAWNVCYLALDKDLFLKNFTEDDLDLTITLASRTTGTLHLDDIVLAPMTMVDGVWTAVVGGSTPFRVLDKFTTADTDGGTTTTLMYWLWRAGAGVIFPSATGGNETDADPS